MNFVVEAIKFAGVTIALIRLIQVMRQYFFRRTPLNKFYQAVDPSWLRHLFGKKSRDVKVVLSHVPFSNADSEEVFKETTAFDSVKGFATLSKYYDIMGYSLGRNSTSPVVYAKNIGIGKSENTLIVVGGFENNEIAAEINARANRIYKFVNNAATPEHAPLGIENKLEKRNGNKQENNGEKYFTPKYDGFGRIVKDYCLITRDFNHFDRSGRSFVISFEGMRHFGTMAGIEFMNASQLRRLYKEYPEIGVPENRIEIVIAVNIAYKADDPASFVLDGVEMLDCIVLSSEIRQEG